MYGKFQIIRIFKDKNNFLIFNIFKSTTYFLCFFLEQIDQIEESVYRLGKFIIINNQN